MKIEVVSCSTEKTIETYSLPGVEMANFQEWEETLRCIPLSKLSNLAKELSSEDPKAAELMPVPISVDFYIPTPLRRCAFDLFAESHTKEEELSEKLAEDFRRQIIEQAFTLAFRVSDVFAAVVAEISLNHAPHSEFRVRMSDG